MQKVKTLSCVFCSPIFKVRCLDHNHDHQTHTQAHERTRRQAQRAGAFRPSEDCSTTTTSQPTRGHLLGKCAAMGHRGNRYMEGVLSRKASREVRVPVSSWMTTPQSRSYTGQTRRAFLLERISRSRMSSNWPSSAKTTMAICSEIKLVRH